MAGSTKHPGNGSGLRGVILHLEFHEYSHHLYPRSQIALLVEWESTICDRGHYKIHRTYAKRIELTSLGSCVNAVLLYPESLIVQMFKIGSQKTLTRMARMWRISRIFYDFIRGIRVESLSGQENFDDCSQINYI